jgi:hypothetical protein
MRLKHVPLSALQGLLNKLSQNAGPQLHKHKNPSESLGVRTLSIVRNSKTLENTTFRKLDLFTSDCLRLALCK